jgi:NADH dehydrogenase FAD-containing subunit
MGAPLAHTSASFASEAWLHYRNISALTTNGIRVLQGRAVSLDMDAKVLTYSADGMEPQGISYDYLVVASGIKRAWPVVPRAVSKEPFLRDARAFIDGLSTAHTIAIVGGGELRSAISAFNFANQDQQALWELSWQQKSSPSSPIKKYA